MERSASSHLYQWTLSWESAQLGSSHKRSICIYLSVKKLSFYITDVDITLRSDHLPLKQFLLMNTLNAKVNNWAVELETYRIKFVPIKGKSNMLANTMSRLITIDLDIKLDPELP